MNGLRFSRKLLAPILLGGTSLALACANVQAAAPLQASCHLQSAGNKIKRVVYLQFDNVHLRRDNPNVPSDLEQMPHLLNSCSTTVPSAAIISRRLFPTPRMTS
jgi:hypothetical protein